MDTPRIPRDAPREHTHALTSGWLGLVLAATLTGSCSGGAGSGPQCDAPEDAWVDVDGDGFGDGSTAVASVCPGTEGYADNPLDCDDAAADVNPGVEEGCNGIDDDCNGEIDNGLDGTQYYADTDGDGFGVRFPSQIGCADPGAGWARNAEDCDDGDPNVNPDASEVCDGGVDDDCNGLADDSDPTTDAATMTLWYHDADADGHGDHDDSLRRCIAPTAFVADDTDCNDAAASVNPDATEICDQLDNDCDGKTDDADASIDPASQSTFYADGDGDGFGDGAVEILACRAIAGLSSANPDDCDDGDPRISPADPELVCDAIDNDCDVGTLDAPDFDADGFTVCAECNDANGAINPAATEIPADLVDQDCDGLEACYDDADRDGARALTTTEVADMRCTQPGHLTAAAPIDCDDGDPNVNVDVGWYMDLDGDGFGGGDPVVVQCTDPGGGLVRETDVLDCDDADPVHSPDTTEVCDDGTDENCDLLVDCDDPTCAGSPTCLGPCADQALASVVPVVTMGTTAGQGNQSNPQTCAFSSAPELAFQWTPPADGLYTIDTFGSAYDTVLYVTRGCGGQEVGCNDDTNGLQSQVQVQGFAGEPLIIFVDGFSSNSGQFVLNIN